MKIGIIGAGNVGGTLGQWWSQLGHEVFFGLRNPETERPKGLADEARARIRAGSVRKACEASEVIVPALRGKRCGTRLRPPGI